jgi:hypothetical protein
MNDPIDPALQAHYARGEERDRLTQAHGILEFGRTKEIVLRHLPGPPSVIADIDGGPGRYALWLAERGHRVEHRDLVPLHVDQLQAVAHPTQINAAVGDARDLDLGEGTVDAVLLLGRSRPTAGRLTGVRGFHLDAGSDRMVPRTQVGRSALRAAAPAGRGRWPQR